MVPGIGIDYTPAWEQGAGIGRYVRELVAALAREDRDRAWRLFVAGSRKSRLPKPPGENFHWRPAPFSARSLQRLWFRAHLPLPVETFTGPLTLFHATDFVLPPVRRGTRTLVQVHDLSFLRVPETSPPALRSWLEHVVPASVRRADHVLADSSATRDDLLEHYKETPGTRITVLHGGVDERFLPEPAGKQLAARKKYGLDQWPFIFSVGTLQPRKNHGRLVQALSRLVEGGLDLHLVIAGGAGWLSEPFHQQLRESEIEDRVHLTGFVDDADLPALYSAAEVFAFPSLYEGFGLPVLEAMACGTPVVTSDLSSLPEVAGDAALLTDPLDVEALADALRRLISDSQLRQQLIRAGQTRAGQFTWRRAALQLLDVYRRVGDSPAP
ncbi:MAG: glycosyltransferase family 1 protein [Anaerolineaceae bacterium]|nr:glycosyltransferase family 1 protein [Anaerolineaceae bacterium]